MHWTAKGARVEDPAIAQIDEAHDMWQVMPWLEQEAEDAEIRQALNERGLLIAA